MTADMDKSPEGRELWRRARQEYPLAAQTVRPDEAERASLLAAYLEGGLAAAEQERVERWLAADSEALENLIFARAGLGAEMAAPASLLSRAQGLVRDSRSGSSRAGPLAKLRALFSLPLGLPLWQPAGLAAALLLACVVGFELGQAGYASVLTEPATVQGDTPFDLASSGDDFF